MTKTPLAKKLEQDTCFIRKENLEIWFLFMDNENKATLEKFTNQKVRRFLIIKTAENKCLIIASSINIKYPLLISLLWNYLKTNGLIPKELPQEKIYPFHLEQNKRFLVKFIGYVRYNSNEIEYRHLDTKLIFKEEPIPKDIRDFLKTNFLNNQ